MFIGESIAKRDRSLLAHHMIAWRDQHEPVFGKRKGLKFFGGINLVSDDADVGEASGNSAHDVAAGTLLQIDVDLGMLRQECGPQPPFAACLRLSVSAWALPMSPAPLWTSGPPMSGQAMAVRD